jgi:hypothetical protein
MERWVQEHLRGVNQALQILGLVRNSGNAAIGFNPNQEGPAIRVGHAGNQAGDLSGQIFNRFYPRFPVFILVSADKI